MPQFDAGTYSSQLFWLFIVLGIIYFYAKNFIAPIAQDLQDRRNYNIGDSTVEADKTKEMILELQKSYAVEVKNMHSAVDKIKLDNTENLHKVFLQKKESLNNEIGELNEKTINELKIINQNFWTDKEHSCLLLATAIIEKVVKMTVDQELLSKCYNKVK